MHECGHGLYEWGVSPTLERTPLCTGVSATLHESQSRLWENVVGRSLPFWTLVLPARAGDVPRTSSARSPLEDFHRAVNRVRRSFIRVDADETSYGLHVILRFELEQRAHLGRARGRRPARGLEHPLRGARGHRRAERRARRPPGHALVRRRVRLLPDLSARHRALRADLGEGARGDPGRRGADRRAASSASSTHWLRENIYALGRKLTPAETVERVVGGPIDPQPYLAYLREKLGAATALA